MTKSLSSTSGCRNLYSRIDSATLAMDASFRRGLFRYVLIAVRGMSSTVSAAPSTEANAATSMPELAGIDVPILPGVMPITNLSQIKTITGMCAATIPRLTLEALEWRAHDPDAVLQLGVAYATLQCAELLARGAPGIHFYTLNRSHATRAILSALKLLRPWVNREVVRTAG